MPQSNPTESLTLEWRIGGAAAAFFVVFVGWARLRPRTAESPAPAVAADVRGAPLRSDTPPTDAPSTGPVSEAPPPVADPAPPTSAAVESTSISTAEAPPTATPSAPTPSATTADGVAGPRPEEAPDAGAPKSDEKPAVRPTVEGATESPAPSTLTKEPKADEPTTVTIETLSNFEYRAPGIEYDDKGGSFPAKLSADSVPKEIRALSGKKVAIEGYMMPFDFADDACTKFALSNIPPGCCFGCAMRPNNWIEVTMAKDKKAKCSNASQTVRVVGVLAVHGADAERSPLYTMTADAVDDSK